MRTGTESSTKIQEQPHEACVFLFIGTKIRSSQHKAFVNIRTALLFGASSIATVFVSRKFILPFFSDETGTIAGQMVSQSMLTMILFALLMLATSLSMITSGSRAEMPVKQVPANNRFRLMLYGLGVGLVTGFLVAGGGS